MQKSVKKSNKKTGAAGKYTASGAFGGAQPSNLVELIEAQRGKAASSVGKKQAADTALANEWANLQLQSFGQFGADPAAIAGQQAGQTAGGWLRSSAAKPKNTALANEWADLQLQSFGQFGADTLSPTWGRVEETPEMTAAEREREAQWYEQNANAYNALGADGQSTVQRANDAANRWDIANNMYPWMLDTSGLGMPIDQQLAMADAYEERRQATAALEQAANSLPADVDARSLSRYAQQLENARYAQELETSARQGAGEAPILHNAASVAANAWNLPAALDYAKQWARNTFTGDYAPIDVNTPAQTMNIYRDAVRDETGRNIEEGLGGGLAGKAASFAYQTGMSWADSLANMAMSGGNPYLSGVLMGSGTMTSTVRSAKEKGASDSQAMGAGVAAGIFEGLFEQYSIENLSWMAKSDPRTFLDVVKNLGKSILGEGSEELFTELANAAADTLIMGDLSDYNLAMRQYRAQGESEEEARRHAGWDVAKQAGLAFAGGGLMGFGSAAGGMAYNGAANRYAAPRAVESGSFYNALQYGLAQGEDTAAGRLARELAGRDTASSADVMRMLRAAESRQAEGGPGTQALVDPQLYTRAEVQGMSAGEVRENYDAIQESMRLWNKNGELLQSAETETARRMALETGRAGKTDLDWLEHLAGTAKMELQYVFQPGSGVQAAVQGRRITVNLGGAGYAFGAAVHELGHSMKAADAKAYAKFESAVLGLAQSDAALEQIARQTAADYLSPDSPARAGLLDAQGNIDAAALNEEISLRLAQELVADPEKLVRAVERDRGLMETFLDFVRGLKNRIAIRLSGSERAMLDEAERTLVNLLRGEAGSVAGEKYSFVRATDAEQIARAQELEAQGENAKTIWSETHLTRDGGGAWVREINDRGAKPRPDGDARGETGGRLADYLEHPELYEAEPWLREIPVRLWDKSYASYNAAEQALYFNKEQLNRNSVGTFLHELQHAIQKEQGLVQGGSRELAYAALVSDAYEAVKSTPEFQSLQTKEEKLRYLEETAVRKTGAANMEDAAKKIYTNLGGEKMARQTALRWPFDDTRRENRWPDVAGQGLDKAAERARFVEMLGRIGYTEDEIKNFMKKMGG
ncbi:MAG: hypothetical protein ACLTV4_11670 [Ruthenibacterium lactatiformans]